MDKEYENMNFRLQLSLTMISGVSFCLIFQRLKKLQAMKNYIKDDNFNNITDVLNDEHKSLKIFKPEHLEKNYFGITKILVQGSMDATNKQEVRVQDPFVIHDYQYVSYIQDVHNYYGIFDENKINYQIAPQIYLKDFSDSSQKIKCLAHQKDLTCLYSLCQKVQIQPYFGFKALALSFFNFFTLIFNKQKKLEIIQEKSDVFAIRSNIPCFMLADLVVNKKSGKLYLRTSEFIEKSPKALKKLISKKQIPIIIGLLLSGYLTYYFGKKSFNYIWKKFRNYQSYVEMKKSIKKMESQTQKIKEVHRCVICFDNIRNIILYPCKHVVLCFYCYKEMSKQIMGSKCPICKTNIENIQAIAFKDV